MILASHRWLACALLGTLCALACRGAPPATKETPLLVGPEDLATARELTLSVGPQISGFLEPKERAELMAQANGSVVAVHKELDDAVAKGEVLVEIEAGDLHEAQRSARAEADATQSQLDQAQRQLERGQKLREVGGLSQQDLESLQVALTQARARLRQARAQLSSASERLADVTIRAPMAGRVAALPVHTGDVVAPGTPLLTLIDPSSMRLEASITETALPHVQVGQPVRFEVRGHPDERFEGVVDRIAPAADPQTRQVPILVSIPNPSEQFLAGLYAEGRIGSTTATAVTVPTRALDTTTEPATVAVIRAGRVHLAEVRPGVLDPARGLVQVQGDVQAGDRVLLGELSRASAGRPVEMLQAETEAPQSAKVERR